MTDAKPQVSLRALPSEMILLLKLQMLLIPDLAVYGTARTSASAIASRSWPTTKCCPRPRSCSP